jgi:hypothetical protein
MILYCSIPTDRAILLGTSCDWYATCLASNTANCPIIEDTMEAKCIEYQELEPSLSHTGQKWSQYVRQCLQQTLATTELIPAYAGEVDCAAVTSEFFDGHVMCYLNGPVSFCDLPHTDMGYIFYHGSSIFWSSHWYAPLITGAQLKYACDVDFWDSVLTNKVASQMDVPIDVAACNISDSSTLADFINAELSQYNWTVTFVPTANISESMIVVSTDSTTLFPLNSTLAGNNSQAIFTR